MFESIKNSLRARTLRKYAYKKATGLRSLSEVRAAAVLMNVETPGYEPLKQRVTDWFKNYGIRTELYFFDFRKLEKEELLLTPMKTTFLKRELNWYDRLAADRIEAVAAERPYDVFISLVPDAEFPTKLLSSCMPASFKVGIYGYEGAPYDLVVSAPTPPQAFELIADTLEKIR